MINDKLGRQKNRNWALEAPNNWAQVPICILQDIRDELQELNSLLRCRNVTKGFLALAKLARNDEKTFQRRVKDAARKRVARKAAK